MCNPQMYLQGTAPITGLTGTLSDSEDSDNNNHESTDSSKAEKLFLTGLLDELKISISYSSQVNNFTDLRAMYAYSVSENELFAYIF